MAKMGEKVGDLDFHLRSLGSNARDSSSASDPASDPHIIQSVRKIYEICKEEGSEDLVARAYPQIKKLFQRSVLALPNSHTSNGSNLPYHKTQPRTKNTVKGAILPVDVRARHFRSLRYYAGYTSMSNEVQEDSNSSSMPSAICSLAALKSDQKYILGSSMDGCLFDLHLFQRHVQSYKGHVNSHSHLRLGVVPSESFFMSGGEDHFLCIRSIKTGELLFAKNFANATLNSIFWSQTGNISKEMQQSSEETVWHHESRWELEQSWRAWLGSHNGLFYMHGT